MSQYHIDRVASVLEQTFGQLIDMADWARKPDLEAKVAFLTRALAALCIKSFAQVDDKTAADSVTDGYDDGGIDALLFDQTNDTFYFVQSKWDKDGSAPMNAAACGNFADGVQDLLAGRIERFNSKVKQKEPEIVAALRATRNVQMVLVTAHVSTQDIGPHGRRKIDDLVKDINVPSMPEQAAAVYINQEKVYGLITSISKPRKIDMPITLANWGSTDRPFLSFYGRANIVEVAGWWREHGNALCDKNIRYFFHRSDVNDALRETLAEHPEYFWYFNNGITVICNSVRKSLAGSPGRDVGLFHCSGVSVVNGAQTVGMIGSVVPQAGAASEAVQAILEEQSWVQVRVISLERCPPGFDRLITQAANFQNAVQPRDFAAMDPIQHRLATDFALDRRRYVYKSGEEDPKGDDGCSITEATQALGCAASIDIAVRVKRGISELWRQTDRAPYTEVFNDTLTSGHLWKAVSISRAVDEELQAFRADLAAVHLNRVMLNMVFQDPRVRDFRRDGKVEADLMAAARDSINTLFPRVVAYVKTHHPNEYLGSFCKNTDKCRGLVAALLATETLSTPAPLEPPSLPPPPSPVSGQREASLFGDLFDGVNSAKNQ